MIETNSEEMKGKLPIIFDRLNSLIDFYLSRHSRMFVVRADIRYPKNYGIVYNNKQISTTIENMIDFLKYHKLDPKYMWIREQLTSIHPHYHSLFLLNGQKIRYGRLVYEKLAEYWSREIKYGSKGLIYHCPLYASDWSKTYGMMIYRNNVDKIKLKAIMMYFAKDEGKGKYKDGIRDFGMSRIPKSDDRL